jgi:enoyl-CoA hydratase/carnithine racemase
MTLRESPASSRDGQVTLRIADTVAHVLFDRPWARNAMTWAMYDGLAAACAAINENSSVRVAVLRGAGGKAFVAAQILRSSASSAAAMMVLPTKQGWTALSTR